MGRRCFLLPGTSPPISGGLCPGTVISCCLWRSMRPRRAGLRGGRNEIHEEDRFPGALSLSDWHLPGSGDSRRRASPSRIMEGYGRQSIWENRWPPGNVGLLPASQFINSYKIPGKCDATKCYRAQRDQGRGFGGNHSHGFSIEFDEGTRRVDNAAARHGNQLQGGGDPRQKAGREEAWDGGRFSR